MDRVTDAALRRQRQIQTVLVVIILATVPCYCLGAVLLAVGGGNRPVRTPTPVSLTLTIQANTITAFPSITPFTLVPGVLPTNPIIIQPTPTQINLFPTNPPAFPSQTFTPFLAPSATLTIPPIIIITPVTPTPVPPVLTDTPFPTLTPPPTLTPNFTAPPVIATNTSTATLPPGVDPTPTRAGSQP